MSKKIFAWLSIISLVLISLPAQAVNGTALGLSASVVSAWLPCLPFQI